MVMLSYAVHEHHRRVPVDDYTRDFVDVPRFVEFCRACPQHDQTWACPEFDFDPRDVWARYSWIHLIAFSMDFDPDQRRTGWERDELTREVMDTFHREKKRALRTMIRLRNRVPGSQVLGAGSCELCRVCTRRQGRPCRLPQLLVHSMESMGADVEATSRELFDHPIEWSDGTSLPDSYVIVMGLVCNQPDLPPDAWGTPRHGVAARPSARAVKAQ
ncbi:hypothetical protein EFN18_00495 [Propionibacterium freudenreichii]|nr:hypothetical protein [Propionibacterium freudenreichii]